MALKLISPLDGAFLLVEHPSTPGHGSALMTFAKPPDAAPDFLAQLRESWRGHPLASPYDLQAVKVVPLGYRLPLMRQVEEFDFDNHVRLQTLPAPGGERELGEFVSAQHSASMDFARPLWELHLIDGLTDHRFAIFGKAHHAVMDGTTLLRRLRAWLSDAPSTRDTPPLFNVGPSPRTKPKAAPHPARGNGNPLLRLAGGLGASLRVPVELGRVMVDYRRGTFEGQPLAAPYRLPTTVFRGDITPERRISTQQLKMADLRALADAADGTINGIVLWLVGTALRTYFKEQDAVPDRPPIAGCPVNLRSADDDRAGNVLALITVDVGCLVDDPTERLHTIKRSAQTAKRQLASLSGTARSLQGVVTNGGVLAGMALGLGARTPASFSLSVSNVPGFPEQRYLNGAPLQMVVGATVIAANSPLSVACCSHGDVMSFGIQAATATVPHSQRIATAMAEALEELQNLVLPSVTKGPS